MSICNLRRIGISKGHSTPSPMSGTGKREDTGAPESGLASVGSQSKTDMFAPPGLLYRRINSRRPSGQVAEPKKRVDPSRSDGTNLSYAVDGVSNALPGDLECDAGAHLFIDDLSVVCYTQHICCIGTVSTDLNLTDCEYSEYLDSPPGTLIDSCP